MDLIDQLVLKYLISLQGTAFDGFAAFLVSDDIVKGALVLSALCWYWSTPSEHLQKRRELVIACIAGALFAAAVSRGMTKLVDWHLRPISLPGWSELLPVSSGWEDKGGSFASDHAALAFGLVAGVFLISRWLGVVLALYVTLFVCFPRLYLGVHWLSDILGGMVFGVVSTGVLSMEPIRKTLGKPVLWLRESAPGAFNVLAVFMIWGLMTRFDDVRKILGAVVKWIQG